jgi:O-6-methylguanine DNA methyltransferase
VGVTRHRYVVDGWGVGEVWADEGVLVVHELTFSRATGARRAVEHGARANDGFVPALCRRFEAHLGGEPVAYDDVAVDEGWCSPFQAELLGALRAIPWGEVVSYGELAALAGRPGAARAAGSFCARNRFALVVPCHRVVAAEGIGGYGSSGVGVKRRLLALEGVRM